MASNHTPHFGFCQWVAEDQVLREDFNRDNAILEDTLEKMYPVSGSYAGTCPKLSEDTPQTIELGFVPEVLMVFPRWSGTKTNSSNISPVIVTPETYWASFDAETSMHRVILHGTSFTVTGYMNSMPTANGDYTSPLNPYRYVAWQRL